MFCQKSVLGLVVVGALACHSGQPSIAPLPCPANGIDPATLPRGGQQPRPAQMFIPPLPIPSGMRNQRALIRLVVDTAGRVMPDSVMICGIDNFPYRQRVATGVAGMRFVSRDAQPIHHATPVLVVYDF